MKHLAPGIAVFDNVFTESMDYVNEIIYQEIEWRSAEVGLDEGRAIKTNIRDTDVIKLQEGNGILGDFVKSFRNAIDPHLNQYKYFYGVETQTYENAQLLRYGVGQEYIKHVDDSPRLTRRVSLTYYLNDDYEGGDVEFDKFNLRFKAQKNQLLVFPSNYMYNHQVHPVTSGLRYVIVQWMA